MRLKPVALLLNVTLGVLVGVQTSCGSTSSPSASSPASTVTQVTVSPATPSLLVGTTQQFTATVTGTGSPSQAVTWSAQSGQITATGLYTAPASGSADTVTATSVQAPGISGQVLVTLTLPPPATVTSVSLSPSAPTVPAGATQQFTATVAGTGSPSQAVTWTAQNGQISATGRYQAPSGGGTDLVTAASVQNPAILGTATVTVSTPAPSLAMVTSVEILPSAPTLLAGTTLQFTATVEGTGNPSQAVNWTAQLGQITATGLYTAPSTGGLDVVRATSVLNPSIFSQDTVNSTVLSQQPTVSLVTVAPASVSLTKGTSQTSGTSQTFTATVAGTNAPSQGVTWTTLYGTITSSGVYTPPASGVALGDTVTATSVLDPAVSGAATVELYAPPAISSFTAGSTAIPSGSSTTLTAQYTGGTGTVTCGSGTTLQAFALASGALATVSPSATTTYTLTVTNASQTSVTSPVTIQVAPGAFVATSPMVTTAIQRVAVLLPNGQVLLAGGDDGSDVADAELYDPGSGTFTATQGSLFNAASGLFAVPLPNGLVLLGGGAGPGLGESETFDPQTGTFTLVIFGPESPAQGRTATLMPNGKVLVAGGAFVDNGTLTATNNAEQFTPADGEFLQTYAMTIAAMNRSAVLLATGQVLIAGGCDGNYVPTSAAELFDPANQTFTALGNMQSSAYSRLATLLPDGTVLLAGGTGASGPIAEAEVFDPMKKTFTAITPLPWPITACQGTLLPDGKVLIAGGDQANYYRSAVLYDFTTQGFTPTASCVMPSYGSTATLLPSGQVLLAGGNFPSIPLANTPECYEAFDPFPGFSCIIYVPSVYIFNTGTSITPVRPLTSGTPTAWIVSPSLPAGLIMDPAGTITGIPTEATQQTLYTVTGSNGANLASTSLWITVQ